MALTPEQITQMNQITGMNKPVTPAQASSQSRAQQILALVKPEKKVDYKGAVPFGTPETNSGAKIADAFNSGAKQVYEGVNQALHPGQAAGNMPLGVLKAGAGVVNAVMSPIAPGMKPISDTVNAVADKVSDNKGVQDFAQSKTGEIVSKGAEGAANASTIAGAIAGGVKAPEVGTTLKNTAGDIKDALTPEPPPPGGTAAITQKTNLANKAKDDEYIASQYTKAIKPTIVGKTNPGQLEKYNASVGKAISTIVENKPHLTLTDQFGEATGKLPQTIDEFRQAIDQSKAAIFKQYDSMAKTAGESGATVDLNPAARELQKVANNKVVQDLHPDLAAYATSRAEALTKRGTYTTEEAQAATQNLNKSLDAYYRNPSYETASRASVDALIANQLRAGLDSSIEKAGQAGYGELKGKYAALKAIEKDVTKRGIVEARQTGGRGLNVGDVISAEELVRGLATMNPQALATAGAIKGIQALRRWYTDPNRAIKQMFEKADTTTQPSSNQATPSPTGKIFSSPQDITKSIQTQMPNLQHARVVDIAQRAAELAQDKQSAFIQNELSKIDPKSIPGYPNFEK